MKKHINKELVMTKEDNENSKNSTKCWICDNDYVGNGVKVRDHCHINEKCRGSPHRYCHINFELNHTDSLMFGIKTEDIYEDFSSDKEMFDFNNYFTKSKYYSNSKKLVIRKMKDQTGGVVIEEFVGLMPKMYSFLVVND